MPSPPRLTTLLAYSTTIIRISTGPFRTDDRRASHRGQPDAASQRHNYWERRINPGVGDGRAGVDPDWIAVVRDPLIEVCTCAALLLPVYGRLEWSGWVWDSGMCALLD